jgi:arylsulfatase A-like enzyme
MLRVIFASVYLLLLLLSPSLQAESVRAEKKLQPNILILLADDLGYNDSGIFRDVYQQRPVTSMPVLEAFAHEGVRFSRFYTESTCSASRVALLTGQYPARHGFIPAARGISPDVVTLPKYLLAQGYVTHHVGKWHAGEINREAFPAAQGFSSSFGFLSQWMLQGPDANGNAQLKSPTYHNPWLMDEREHYQQYEGHLEDILTAHTLKIIHESKQQPWFIYHAFLAPHAPLQPSPEFAKNFPSTPEGKYLALLAQLDHNLEKIFLALKASRQWDNTIIIFASDNGSQAKHANSNAPFAGGKANYNEGGIRAPLVIKWHKDLAVKMLRTDPVSILDIYPSLQIIVGGALPGVLLDGKPVLLPEAKPLETPSLKAFYSFDGLSFFDVSGRQRLIREWNTTNFTRSEWLHYDERAFPFTSKNSFWERWFPTEDAIEEKIFQQFLEWRNEVRRVPVKMTTLADPDTYQISGSDFLRTPINPAYALVFSFTPKSNTGKHLLLAQQGMMEVSLENETLSATVHGIKVKADGFMAGQCYRIVLSGAFYDQYSTAREGILPSRLHLVVDGVLQDSAEATVESFAALAIGTPHLAKGISPPRFFTTQLLPGDRPFSSGLDRELAGLCKP